MILDALAVAVALPSIERDLNFSATTLQWVVSAYGLTFGGFLLLAGRLGDIADQKTVLLVGVALFAAGSCLGGLALSSHVLVSARALQGLGAALSAPAALAFVAVLFPEDERRVRALAIWSAIGSVGLVAGAIVGGVVTEGFGWRWILLANIPICATAVAALAAILPSTRAKGRKEPLDLTGAVTVTASAAALIYAATSAHTAGFLSWRTLGAFGLSCAALGSFVYVERHARAPLVPFRIFRSRSLVGANTAAFLLNGGFAGSLFLTTLYLQKVLGYRPLATGLAFVPLGVGTIIGSLIAAPLTTRTGAKLTAAGGLSAMAVGMGLLATASPQGGYVEDVLAATTLIGVGVAVAYVPITLAAVGVAPDSDRGVASGLYHTTGQIGGAVLLALLAVIASAFTARTSRGGAIDEVALTKGFSAAYVSGAAVLVVAAASALLLIRIETERSPADA